jgi:transposase
VQTNELQEHSRWVSSEQASLCRGCLKSPYDPRLSDPVTTRKPPVTPPRRAYATDLTDAEWQLLAPLVPAAKPGGRPPIHDRRELVNAMAYWLRAGCAWRLLPHDLPPWQTVYHYFGSWRRQGLWEQVHAALRAQERVRQGRGPTPSAAILDSQSVKTAERGGGTVTTAPRRSTAASATCWSTPSAWSARSR